MTSPADPPVVSTDTVAWTKILLVTQLFWLCSY